MKGGSRASSSASLGLSRARELTRVGRDSHFRPTTSSSPRCWPPSSIVLSASDTTTPYRPSAGMPVGRGGGTMAIVLPPVVARGVDGVPVLSMDDRRDTGCDGGSGPLCVRALAEGKGAREKVREEVGGCWLLGGHRSRRTNAKAKPRAGRGRKNDAIECSDDARADEKKKKT